MFSSQNSQVSNDAVFVEDIFSTYLYTPTTSNTALNIPNGIDLSTKGGMVWFKKRSGGTQNHSLVDTVRGGTNLLTPNDTFDAYTASIISSFNTNGFTTGTSSFVSIADQNFASWTFRKQPKFFDVVTYTGDGTTSRSISHNLTSTPGCIIVKRTDSTGSWYVYHRGVDPTSAYAWYLLLNSTAARAGAPAVWDVPPTSTAFTVQNGTTNDSGATYVAYLFAHNAGGFGLSGSENVISCGSYTGNGSATGPVITLGYEPQWVMVKRATVSTGSWEMYDSMRGFTMEADAVLRADTSGSEFSLQRINPTSTGFQLADSDGDVNANGSTYIYIAIRRGPMKVPTSGTSVFSPVARTGTGTATNISGIGFAPDFVLVGGRDGLPYNATSYDRLRGSGYRLKTAATSAEGYDSDTLTAFGSNSLSLGVDNFGYINTSGGVNYINWIFKRAPSFFDEVCYTGTGTTTQIVYHNLNSEPNLVIQKRRNSTSDWYVSVTDGAGSIVNTLLLNTTGATGQTQACAYTSPTYFGAFDSSYGNISGATYVAYLFATCAGVSKVGSYTGTGTTKQVDCGFTGGARFVLIKRTDSTGSWYVWDVARGISSGNDPYLLLNSTAAEVTNTDYIDAYSAGFEISSTAPAEINASGGSFIFLAIS